MEFHKLFMEFHKPFMEFHSCTHYWNSIKTVVSTLYNSGFSWVSQT